jgi:FAD/FMN-containing dehydrogenase
VTFEDLVAVTLQYGLMPAIVPELKTITIGGAVSGCSIESMSYRYGGFHDTCLAYEVITATGDVITATPCNEHALVFQMMHGSFGTLGILAKLTFRLVPAKPYVRVDYEKYLTLDDFQAAVYRHFEAEDVDFMDGIIHAPDELVLCVGRFCNEVPYTHAYKWFRVYWKSTARRSVDYMTTPEYLFRYDRGVTSVHPILGSHKLLALANKLPFLFDDDQPTVTLDTFLPFSRVPAFLDWYTHSIGHFPLWVVPYRRVHDYEWLADSFYQTLDDQLFLDIAIYGLEQPRGRNIHREIETKLREIGGVKTLIAHNYYSPDEFWSIWNKPNYDRVKALTDPDNVFRDLYAKTCRAAMGLSG